MTDLDQKAREIVRGVRSFMGGEMFRAEPDAVRFVEIALREAIAAALLSVRTETLEEAARVADSHADNGRDEFAHGVDTASERIAEAIRSLKQKVPE